MFFIHSSGKQIFVMYRYKEEGSLFNSIHLDFVIHACFISLTIVHISTSLYPRIFWSEGNLSGLPNKFDSLLYTGRFVSTLFITLQFFTNVFRRCSEITAFQQRLFLSTFSALKSPQIYSVVRQHCLLTREEVCKSYPVSFSRIIAFK